MSDKKNEWERRLSKVLLPIVTSDEELTLEALKEADYPGDENQLLEDLHELESYGMIKKSSVGGGFGAKRPGQTVDRFTCSVEHIGADAAYLRLRGETDGELREGCQSGKSGCGVGYRDLIRRRAVVSLGKWERCRQAAG